jgi:hypothetical protein
MAMCRFDVRIKPDLVFEVTGLRIMSHLRITNNTSVFALWLRVYPARITVSTDQNIFMPFVYMHRGLFYLLMDILSIVL